MILTQIIKNKIIKLCDFIIEQQDYYKILEYIQKNFNSIEIFLLKDYIKTYTPEKLFLQLQNLKKYKINDIKKIISFLEYFKK